MKKLTILISLLLATLCVPAPTMAMNWVKSLFNKKYTTIATIGVLVATATYYGIKKYKAYTKQQVASNSSKHTSAIHFQELNNNNVLLFKKMLSQFEYPYPARLL